MNKHRIKAICGLALCVILITVMSGCSGDKPTEGDNDAIGEVIVYDRELTSVKTDEEDWFADNFNNYQPFLTDDGGMYYYRVQMADSPKEVLFYDDGINGPVVVELPEAGALSVGVILNDVIYGVGTPGTYSEGSFIIKLENGQIEKLSDNAVDGCYFAEDGIYYQSGNTIYSVDYNGENNSIVLEIPEELYYDSTSSTIVVYRGKLWYSYNDYYLKDYNYPMWYYDFDGTVTKFNCGRIEKINNGFIYFSQEEAGKRCLYRFDCEDYCIELVSDDPYMYSYTFFDDYIVYDSFDESSQSGALFKMNNDVCEPFLYVGQLGSSEVLFDVSVCDGRLFVTGAADMTYTYLAEIDLEGNIINKIHEDEFEWYFTDETAEMLSADEDT